MSIAVQAQEAGGELGGGAGIFRPKNPETNNKPRSNTGAPARGSRPAASSHANRGGSNRSATSVAAAAESVDERIDKALNEGNEARGARRFSDAERAYRSILSLRPNDARATYGLGAVYTDQQRWADAEKAYRQAVLASPKNADAYLALSYVLLQPQSGGSLARRLADAETFARRAIQLQPTNAIAYDRLGAVLEARGVAGTEAEQSYRHATELDPQLAIAYVHLARLLRKHKSAREAEPFYAQALQLAKDAPTLVLIADALQSEQRFDDSEKPLRRALELDAKNPSALFLLGRLFIMRKNYKEAEPILLRTIEVSPRSFAPYYILASAYLRMNRIEDAESICNRAVALASGDDRTLLAGNFGFTGVGDEYMKAGRTSDAMRAYKSALTLDPSNAVVNGKINNVRVPPKR
jgi:tetratricopeptide (TPR) repeat protein